MTLSSRKTNPKKIFDPKQHNVGGNIGIAGLLVAAMGERIGRGYVLPVYERGVALVKRIHPRVWAITGIMVSILVLLIVVYAGISLFTGEEPVEEPATITIAEALRAPYDLNEKSTLDPEAALGDVIPQNFGDFTRVVNVEADATFGRLTNCLVDNGFFECGLDYTPQYSNASFYEDSRGNRIEVVAANYWNEESTSDTMYDAVGVARTFSRVGNFVVGVGEIEYFYSTTRNWFSFTWGHGAWIFSVSASNADVLELALQSLPY